MPQVEKAIDLNTLKQLFQKSADIDFQEYTFSHHKVQFITCNAMIDQQLLNEVIIQRVQYFFNKLADESIAESVITQLHIPNLKQVTDKAEAISLVYTGYLLLFFEEESLLYASNIAKKTKSKSRRDKIGSSGQRS